MTVELIIDKNDLHILLNSAEEFLNHPEAKLRPTVPTKVVLSIMNEVSDLLQKKWLSKRRAIKPFKLKLSYHFTYSLHQILMRKIESLPADNFERTLMIPLYLKLDKSIQ